jgi:NAD(P)-dependent dehydrogenase (short-subunit alcohol dehydrogenase family)
MNKLIKCYICKSMTSVPHAFYGELCSECGEKNFAKRNATADLKGTTALVTGGRLKIGFHTTLKLLRSGARVAITTRFVEDAHKRFAAEDDSEMWIERLQVYAADFRVLASVEHVIERVSCEFDVLDILINNAAQTVRRPPAFYQNLFSQEKLKLLATGGVAPLLPSSPVSAIDTVASEKRGLRTQSLCSDPDYIACLSQVPLVEGDEVFDEQLFPKGRIDKDGQQEDRRDKNSWMMMLDEVSIPEMLEVLYINVVAPFVLCSRLKNIMRKRADQQPSFIVNVSAMEGNFSDPDKKSRHPHTNMAKAAINMMTRTTAEDFRCSGIFMNAVDPGYITNEKPFPLSQPLRDRRLIMAIDEIDGAARVCDPIFRAINNNEYFAGELLKNYSRYPW